MRARMDVLCLLFLLYSWTTLFSLLSIFSSYFTQVHGHPLSYSLLRSNYKLCSKIERCMVRLTATEKKALSLYMFQL